MRVRSKLFKINQQYQEKVWVFCGRAKQYKTMKLKNNQQGFTLLELLVVVAVMAVIAGAAMMSMSGQEEHAGQGVAMHTMQTLENATNQFEVTNKVFPNNLESLMCADSGVQTTNGLVVDANSNTPINTIAGDGDASGFAATTVRIFGGLSNAAGIGGGLTNSFAGKLNIESFPTDAATTLINGGLTTFRYAAYSACDDDETTAGSFETIDGATIGDTALNENPLVQMIFDQVGTTVDGATPGGAGFPVTVDTAAVFPMVRYADPTDIGAREDDIIVVLGIGNSSDLVAGGQFLFKAPRDGNVGRDKYAHYSLALKVGQFQANAAAFTDLTITEVTPGVSADGIDWLAAPELIAVIDADGDYYEEEIAEFAGLQDEDD